MTALSSLDLTNATIQAYSGILYSGGYSSTVNYANEIPASAFYYFNTLTTIILPKTTTAIKESAFYNCYALATVKMWNSVKSIGNSAFNYCQNLSNYQFFRIH